MDAKRFRHGGQEWEVTPYDVGVGAGSGEYDPPADQWSMTFKCISDPSKGEVRALVRHPDPGRLSDQQLTNALRCALSRRKES